MGPATEPAIFPKLAKSSTKRNYRTTDIAIITTIQRYNHQLFKYVTSLPVLILLHQQNKEEIANLYFVVHNIYMDTRYSHCTEHNGTKCIEMYTVYRAASRELINFLQPRERERAQYAAENSRES